MNAKERGQGCVDRMMIITETAKTKPDYRKTAAALLERYLKRRKDGEKALFVGQGVARAKLTRLQQNGVRVMLKRIGKRAGVEHVHPHKFRRTMATELARHGMPIQTVSHLLGHEKIDTTMMYVMQKPEDVKIEYRRFA
jgi:site-specific recombinase XerD